MHACFLYQLLMDFEEKVFELKKSLGVSTDKRPLYHHIALQKRLRGLITNPQGETEVFELLFTLLKV